MKFTVFPTWINAVREFADKCFIQQSSAIAFIQKPIVDTTDQGFKSSGNKVADQLMRIFFSNRKQAVHPNPFHLILPVNS